MGVARTGGTVRLWRRWEVDVTEKKSGKKSRGTSIVGVRLPNIDKERARALVEPLGEDPGLRAVGRITLSAVVRIALTLGLDELERTYGGRDD
jgi:hypothetical protein